MKFVISLLIIASIVFGMTGCNKVASIRKAKEQIAKARIYGRNIVKANNEGFQAGNITAGQLQVLTAAAKKYRDAINTAESAINAAEAAVNAGADSKTVLDVLQKEMDTKVFNAFLAFIQTVTTVPPAVTDKVKMWLEAIQVIITTFRSLFADAHMQLGGIPDVRS